jgi:serine protease Do
MRTIRTALPLLLLLASGEASWAREDTRPAATPAAPASAEKATEEDLRFARNLSRAFRQVARTVQPSVVSIRTVDEPVMRNVGMPALRFGPRGPELVRPEPAQQRRGLGTGFILSEDGAIVTNSHVVQGADRIMVRLADDRELEATLVGVDPETDVAVLRVPASGLVPARLIESSQVEVGDWVLALGSPFGLDQTVTAGIISAKGREGVGLAVFENYLQTDAAINPGNSGGPLVTLDGAVVGMNTAIGSRTGGNDGVGFAIPMEMVRRAADDLLQDGRVRYGYMGVLLQEMPDGGGAMIGRVLPDGPADKAAVREGDRIVSVAGTQVDSRASLMRAIGARKPGESVLVEVDRDGERLKLQVTLGTRPTAGVAVRDDRGQMLVPNR